MACSKEELTSDIEVYFNDFENNELSEITGGRIIEFDGQHVNGNFNNDGFQLHLNNLPDHEYVFISFDLLIHDTWDGNFNGFDDDYPDSWTMDINSNINLNKVDDMKFTTTFSNTPCDSELCLWQSYPSAYPFLSGPQSGRTGTAPGMCVWSDRTNGTSVYRVQKTYEHKDKALFIDFYDRLYQPNVPSAKCDESWSLDNLMIRTLIID
jgi:hypothetical protein